MVRRFRDNLLGRARVFDEGQLSQRIDEYRVAGDAVTGRPGPDAFDEFGRRLADRAGWLAATSLQDLAEQTARWLEGASTYLPTYAAPGPDPETGPLLDVLARMNRLGLMTDTSQPGKPLVNGCGQRAGLMGWCSEEVADRVVAGTLGTDLVVMVGVPGAEGAQVVVTLDGGAEFTWFGMGDDPEGLVGVWGEDLGGEALTALLDAWTVTVIDPVWGRDSLLWPTVLAALERPAV